MSIDRGLLARLAACCRGNSATIVALSLPALLGGMALGIDMTMARMTHNRMQIAVDGAALAAAAQIERGGDITGTALSQVQADLPAEFGGMTEDTDITTGIYDEASGFTPDTGPDVNAVRVTAERSPARGNSLQYLMAHVLGVDLATIRVAAVAARPVNVWYQPPERETLDPEAGDFNEIYVYCYDTLGSGSPESRRSQMTLVSNNMPAGQNIVAISGGRVAQNPPTTVTWPRCTQRGQTLSFRLRNVRHVKANPVLWSNPNATISGLQPGRPEFNYYTDTVLNEGTEIIDLQGFNVLETVLCDSLSACTPGGFGSQIPSGRNRAATRLRESEPCQPGKFMYFGFEDRPPGQSGRADNWLWPAWTDSDFDDIRIVMKCPNSGRLGDALVRLVR
jgi:Flp pilus assembly protein TadG